MNQLGLCFDARIQSTAATIEPAASPPARGLVELAEYDDTGRCGVASYSLTLRNPHFGERCRAGLWVALERHFGWKPHRWMASIYLELPDACRTSWSTHAIYATQDEAAVEAADLAETGRTILERALRGEVVATPGALRTIAAERAADADETLRRLAAAEQEARSALVSLGDDDAGRRAAQAEWWAARDRSARARREFIQVFHDSHNWREFLLMSLDAESTQ